MVVRNLFVFIIAFLVGGVGFSSMITEPTLKGLIVVEKGHYFLQPEGDSRKYFLHVNDSQLRPRLNCLKTGDFMSGSASVISEDQILLRSIDYVGLQKLTGAWRNDTEIFRFYDFRNFSYWNFDRVTQKYRGPFDYHYALSPYGETSPRCLFKMFILDNFGVTLGSLEWAAEDQVHLQIYDPDTGEVSSTKHLIRGVL